MFCCLLFNCNAVKIKEAFRQKVVSVKPTRVHGFNFSLQINVHSLTIIDSVGLGTNCTKIDDYEIFQLPSGTKIKSQSVLNKGDYYINFFIGAENKIVLDSDSACLYYSKSGKINKIIVTARIKQDLIITDEIPDLVDID